jgi:hypothetical protein
MTFLIKYFAPFTSMRLAIINACLSGMSDMAKRIMLGRVLAKSMPRYHIKLRPYHLNPKVVKNNIKGK